MQYPDTPSEQNRAPSDPATLVGGSVFAAPRRGAASREYLSAIHAAAEKRRRRSLVLVLLAIFVFGGVTAAAYLAYLRWQSEAAVSAASVAVKPKKQAKKVSAKRTRARSSAVAAPKKRALTAAPAAKELAEPDAETKPPEETESQPEEPPADSEPAEEKPADDKTETEKQTQDEE